MVVAAAATPPSNPLALILLDPGKLGLQLLILLLEHLILSLDGLLLPQLLRHLIYSLLLGLDDSLTVWFLGGCWLRKHLIRLPGLLQRAEI